MCFTQNLEKMVRLLPQKKKKPNAATAELEAMRIDHMANASAAAAAAHANASRAIPASQQKVSSKKKKAKKKVLGA